VTVTKTIVITGASDGIGSAAARALHDRGHDIVVIGRSPDKITEIHADDLQVSTATSDADP
jgi:short-subunit dehydrogenase